MSPPPDFRLALLAAALAGVGAFGVAYPYARITARVLGAPRGFAPLTWGPILAGCVPGCLGATVVYYSLALALSEPGGAILAVAAGVFAASVWLPLRLLRPRPSRSRRFAGATRGIALAVYGMHAIVAAAGIAATRVWLP